MHIELKCVASIGLQKNASYFLPQIAVEPVTRNKNQTGIKASETVTVLKQAGTLTLL